MLRFWAPEPSRKLTASQQQFARRLLLGIEGEFPRENDAETTPETIAETGEETARNVAPISPPAHPQRRSDFMATIDAKIAVGLEDLKPGPNALIIAVELWGFRYTIREAVDGKQADDIRARLAEMEGQGYRIATTRPAEAGKGGDS